MGEAVDPEPTEPREPLSAEPSSPSSLAWKRVTVGSHLVRAVCVTTFVAVASMVLSSQGIKGLGSALLAASLTTMLALMVSMVLVACASCGSPYHAAHYCSACGRVEQPIVVCPQCRRETAGLAGYTLERFQQACGTCRPFLHPGEIRQQGLPPCCRFCQESGRRQVVLPLQTVGTLTAACRAQLLSLGEVVTARFPHWDPDTRTPEWPTGTAAERASTLVLLNGMVLLVLDLPGVIREKPRYDALEIAGGKLGAVWISQDASPLELARSLDQLSRFRTLRHYLTEVPVLTAAETLPASITARLRAELSAPRCGHPYHARLQEANGDSGRETGGTQRRPARPPAAFPDGDRRVSAATDSVPAKLDVRER